MNNRLLRELGEVGAEACIARRPVPHALERAHVIDVVFHHLVPALGGSDSHLILIKGAENLDEQRLETRRWQTASRGRRG